MRRLALHLWCALSLFACHRIFDGELEGPVACEVEGAYDAPHCPAMHTCVAGVCTAVGAPLGHGCTLDEECRAPAFCLNPADVGAEGEPRCSQTCCASTDCGPISDGQVCWAASGMGSFCWSAAELDRGGLGDKSGGEPCDVPEQCRSGVCDRECVDLCCDSSYCVGQVCRTFPRPELGELVWTCGGAGGPAAEECTSNDDCESSLCLPEVEPDVRFCATPCCSSTECGYRVVTTSLGSEKRLMTCAPTEEGLRACSQLLPTDSGELPLGASCGNHLECRSGFCLTGYCSDSCCTDASCGDQARFACRPVEDSGTWALRCVRK
jgi:hypothetical protein